MKSTTSVFLRVNDLAKSVFGHTLLQNTLAVGAGLRTTESSVHSVTHDDHCSTTKKREVSQILDDVHFCVD
jgi:hypothetical protein